MSSQMHELEAMLLRHPHIGYAFPSSPNFATLREAFILGTSAYPMAIIRPQSAKDVSLVVSYAVTKGVSLTVRSGGHDLFGRCFATDAIAIDMRDIQHVDIAADQQTATIGGGILASDLAEELGRNNLATAVGSSPTVGWVGWATHGGYGPFAANYGLGIDQILNATVVNSNGDIVKADENMLEAIRGGGGCIGVIVAVTIKVYPLNKILGGVLAFKTDNSTATLSRLMSSYNTIATGFLPDALGIQPSFVNTPLGRVFSTIFVWSSNDLELGYIWLEKMKALGDIIQNTVVPRSIKDWLDDAGSFIPKSAYGGSCTVSIRNFTHDVISAVGEHIGRMPFDQATLFSVHQLRGMAACPLVSVFGARTPHYVFEIIATASTREEASTSWEWATRFRNAVKEADPANVFSFTYISLTSPSDAKFPDIYGQGWERLVAIKGQYDPQNVFRHAMPQFD